MAKTEKEEPKRPERKCAGCALSFWVKLVNMCVGALMIVSSFFTFFSVPVAND